jgi:transcription antitermination factor NusG
VAKRWYVIHAFSGMENQVKRALEDRIKRAGVEEQFGDILVPDRDSRRDQEWCPAQGRAQVLSGLCPDAAWR